MVTTFQAKNNDTLPLFLIRKKALKGNVVNRTYLNQPIQSTLKNHVIEPEISAIISVEVIVFKCS